MATTALDIQWTAAATGKKATTKINYINPEADSEELQNLAQSLNSLTNNTYVEANRIDTINVDTETTSKSSRNVEWSTTQANQTCTLTYNIADSTSPTPAVLAYTSGNATMQIISTSSQTLISPTRAQRTFSIPALTNGEIYIGFSETDDFYATFSAFIIS